MSAPFTIAVVNSKGGVAKTTTAVSLSHLFAEATGEKVCLLDLDPQASAASWAESSRESDSPFLAEVQQVPAGLSPARLARAISDIGEGFDWLFIDTAPGDMDRMDAAIEAVAVNGGMSLIPTGVAPLDLARAVVTLEDIDGRCPVSVLLTKTRAGTNAVKQAREQFGLLEAPVLNAEVPLRESIANAPLRGLAEPVALYKEVAVELLERATS